MGTTNRKRRRRHRTPSQSPRSPTIYAGRTLADQSRPAPTADTWVTQDGTVIPVQEMSELHLLNWVTWARRRVRAEIAEGDLDTAHRLSQDAPVDAIIRQRWVTAPAIYAAILGHRSARSRGAARPTGPFEIDPVASARREAAAWREGQQRAAEWCARQRGDGPTEATDSPPAPRYFMRCEDGGWTVLDDYGGGAVIVERCASREAAEGVLDALNTVRPAEVQRGPRPRRLLTIEED